ncbi:MAG: PEP-CTERM sorting domain-containing protein [Pirellulales bacterium]|nr:PEP-CTERM sorting domain-containing protein [Pirellulales bacterium]
MMTMVRLFSAATVVAILALSPVVQAEIITLEAVQDATIINKPSTGRDTTTDGNNLEIRKNGSNDRQEVLYQFDLSNLPGEITAAHIELYDLNGGTAAFGTVHYFATPDPNATNEQLTVLNANDDVAFDQDGMHEEYITFNTYSNAVNGDYWTEQPGATMALNIGADNTAGQYYASADADETGLVILNAAKDNPGYIILLGWDSVSSRTFSDREGGHAPRLVLTAVPEPGTLVLLAGGLVCLAATLRGRRE